MWTKSTVYLIVLAAVANWLPKVFPHLLVRFAKLPQQLVVFLSYLPVSIMFALILSSLFQTEIGQWPSLKSVEALAVVPTVATLSKTKNIIWTVLIGVGTVAVLRALGLLS